MKIQARSVLAFGFLLLPLSGAGSEGGAQDGDAMSPPRSEELRIHLEVPLLDPRFAATPVALVNEEPITLGDLTRLIFATHADIVEQSTAARKDYVQLLDRVITTKLIVEEAKNIGFDEIPEIQAKIDEFTTKRLIAALVAGQLEDVEADPAAVDALYRKLSREYRMTTLKFAKEEDAQAFQRACGAGCDFAAVAATFLTDGRAEGELGSQEYIKLKDLLPNIARAAFSMKVGDTSPIFTAPGGFLIYHVDDARFYEDAGAREEARRRIEDPLRQERANAYFDSLLSKYATVDDELLEEVDFEKERSGFLWFRKEQPADLGRFRRDERVVATVHGPDPFTVTVADLTAELEKRRYHGVDSETARRRLNQKKWPVLRDVLLRRVGRIEAAEQGLDQSDEYRRAVAEYSDALLFEAFVSKVIRPKIKIREAELRAYYEDHPDDFSTPVMLRLNGLAFSSRADAERAVAKLRSRADFKWVSANSPGQVDRTQGEASLFDDAVLSLSALPAALQKAVGRAHEGDSLLYSSPEGYHYAITIDKLFPAAPRAYEETRESIARILYQQKVDESVNEWREKLEQEYEIRVFVTELGG